MTPAQVDLARQLVALPGWRWLPGMRVVGVHPFSGCRRFGRLAMGTGGKLAVAWDDGSYWTPRQTDRDGWLPDLTDDDATGGLLLGMLSRVSTVSVRARPDPYGVSVLYWVDDWPHATPLRQTIAEAAACALVTSAELAHALAGTAGRCGYLFSMCGWAEQARPAGAEFWSPCPSNWAAPQCSPVPDHSHDCQEAPA